MHDQFMELYAVTPSVGQSITKFFIGITSAFLVVQTHIGSSEVLATPIRHIK
jgi:hypothetical protein